MRATRAAAASMAGVRIAPVTSWPSIATRPSPSSSAAWSATAATASSSSSERPSCCAFHATARYIAPVST